MKSISRQQHSSAQKNILKEQSAQTIARVVNFAYCLSLDFWIKRMHNLTNLRTVLYDKSVGSNCFGL